MTRRILVADDDAILCSFIAQGLRQCGYLVHEVATIADAVASVRANGFDLWIFDRKMPGGDMVQALRNLRTEGFTQPAVLLTASGKTEQRIEGLDAGADDYLTKPFSMEELVARVRAILRRPSQLSATVLRHGQLELHLEARRLCIGGRDIAVTANEWRLLALLAQRPEAVFARGQIALEVGVAEDAGEAAVDHLVSRLRQKLSEAGAGATIRTVRGLGFSMAPICRD